MTTPAAATTIRHEIVVQAPIARAFSVFTDDMGSFKPPEHNMLSVDIAETVFEPREGGRVYDRGVDGSECHWARVLAYEPPDRVVISWDISPHWQIEPDLEKTSEVEVRFTSETSGRTRVELEHRNLDRHGDGWEGLREGVRGDQGWPLYLERFAACSPSRADGADHHNQRRCSPAGGRVRLPCRSHTLSSSGSRGVVSGHMDGDAPHSTGARCLTKRRIGAWSVRAIDRPIRRDRQRGCRPRRSRAGGRA
jgi:uncharacterized protein YndB with AHSA1/START domain